MLRWLPETAEFLLFLRVIPVPNKVDSPIRHSEQTKALIY